MMDVEPNTVAVDPGASVLHLESLYGPQWRAVARILERAARLTRGERARLDGMVGRGLHDGLAALSGGTSFAGLLSDFGGPSADSLPVRIATATAAEFGRTQHVHIAGMVAGQVISPDSAEADDLGGLLDSLGTLVAVNRAVTAAVLGDLIGHGPFTDEVYAELMAAWSEVDR